MNLEEQNRELLAELDRMTLSNARWQLAYGKEVDKFIILSDKLAEVLAAYGR